MKLLLKILLWVVIAVVLLVAALAVYTYVTALKPSRPVGFQQVVASDPGGRPIPVDVWYPTNARPGFVLVGTSGQRVASNGAVTGAGLPLVVISHGTGASGTAHADTAVALAEAGFVVAAPTHPGDNFRDQSAVGGPAWMPDRAHQVARVTDFMLGGWRDRGHLDGKRVGVFGFSAGGTTALIAIGGEPDFGQVATRCAARPEFVCQLLKPGAPLRNPVQGWTHDPRIKAAVIAAPGLGFAFEPAGLSRVTIPVQLWSGANDQAVPYATNTGTVRRLLPRPPEAHIVPGAAHLAFLAPCGLIGPPQLCKDAGGFDRKAFHGEFNKAVVAFFRKELAAP